MKVCVLQYCCGWTWWEARDEQLESYSKLDVGKQQCTDAVDPSSTTISQYLCFLSFFTNGLPSLRLWSSLWSCMSSQLMPSPLRISAPDAGAGVSLPVSGAIGFSLVLYFGYLEALEFCQV
ncbi:hypothetical protein Q3G72_030810 [Acer saccharum]|nr:hypothetical protein Q3G72_030810 [Acer saccharum]